MADSREPFSRRTLLFAGGTAAAGMAVGGLGWRLRTKSAPPEDDSPPIAGMFDMRTAAEMLAPSPLFNTTGPQSFAFDDSKGLVYTLQGIQGGLQLNGEKEPVSSADRKTAGDMCLTRMSSSGQPRGHMYLRGFGHGISFGIEPVGKSTLIWVESKPDPESGYGRSVARVLFRDGALLDGSNPTVAHYDPVPGASDVSPALDLAGGRVLVSHQKGEEHRFSVYGMTDFLAGRFEAAHTLQAGVQVKEEEWFQGCALHGDFVYVLTGEPYTGKNGDNPPKSDGNTYVSAIDVRTGEARGRRLVTAARHLPYREPEGIAVSTAGPNPALCVGFSVKARDARELTVYSFAQ
ncbi:MULTISPECIES: signaling protein [unclassified Streptomyces]|uniref:phage baseplate protein n=1 Tax=unclassified Streptomyces TaxID=2593676 RepID=UPI000DC7B037|nr:MULTISPECIES: signaling protein [unclassified Streptomyces]AWZ03855.1 signaling protein [Streptomyces sp. ICC4]AWZ11903.1 signaling protein [Streptomyces sp. ICC1]